MELPRSAAADAPVACAFLLSVQSLRGDAVAVRVHDDVLGRDLERLVTQAVLPKAGANVRVQHGHCVLALEEPLREQGITADTAGLSYAQVRTNLAQASRCAMQSITTQRGVCGCPAHFDWAEKKIG